MDWDVFNRLSTAEKIEHTKANGVKIKTGWTTGDEDAGRIPTAFLNWPNCYYHFEGPESDDESAVLWVNAEFSPSNALNAIVDADPPIIEVLEDNRD